MDIAIPYVFEENCHEMHYYRLSESNAILLQCHTGFGFSTCSLKWMSFKPMDFFDSIPTSTLQQVCKSYSHIFSRHPID